MLNGPDDVTQADKDGAVGQHVAQSKKTEIPNAVRVSVHEPQSASRFWLPLGISVILLLVASLNFSLPNMYMHHKLTIASTASDKVKYQRSASRDKDGNENEVISLVFINEGTVTETVLSASMLITNERVTVDYGSQDPFTLKSGESKLIELTVPVRDVSSLVANPRSKREIELALT